MGARSLPTSVPSRVSATNTFLKAFPNTGCELPTGNEIIHWLGKKFTSRRRATRICARSRPWQSGQKSRASFPHETLWCSNSGKSPRKNRSPAPTAEMERLLKGIPAMTIRQIAIGAFAGLRVALKPPPRLERDQSGTWLYLVAASKAENRRLADWSPSRKTSKRGWSPTPKNPATSLPTPEVT